MLSFKTEFLKNFDNFMIKTILLSLPAIFLIGVSTQAQSLNDDLTPKKATEQKIKSGRTNKKIIRKTSKKFSSARISARQNGATVSNNAVGNSNAVSFVNSDQILARFMSFQQTGSVTSRDWEGVVRQTTQTLQANPNDTKAKAQMLIAQGELAYGRGDYSNALIHFNGASQVLPNSVLPHYGIGKVYLITRQPAEAENSFERAIKIDKGFALAYKGIGDALTAQGKAKKAQEYYENAAKIGLAGGNVMRPSVPQTQQRNLTAESSVKNLPVAQTNVQSSVYQTELKNARALTAQKKWQESLNKLLPLAQSNPSADLYIAIGENYVGLEQMLSAQQAFRKATEFNPNSALAFYKTGMVLFEMNEYKSAAESFEKSLILDQRGTTINRREARRMADKANEKVRNPNGRKKFLKII